MAKIRTDNYELELTGWSPPEYLDDMGKTHEEWPVASVDALINLFAGKPDPEQKTIIIPDILGWHIATLYDALGGHLHRIDDDTTRMEYKDVTDTFLNEAARRVRGSNFINKGSKTISKRKSHEHQVRRTRFLVQYFQNWYSDGIRLYNIFVNNPGAMR